MLHPDQLDFLCLLAWHSTLAILTALAVVRPDLHPLGETKDVEP